MTLSIDSTVSIAAGVEMPVLGLGTYKSAAGAEVEQSVRWALDRGYRLIDTAALYGNEEGVGAGLRASGVRRADVFLATKVWNTEQGYESTLAALDGSLSRLGTDYVDLYLVHWPIRQHVAGTWRAMEEILAAGKTRAIGVCNFLRPHLEELLALATVAPAVNQFEFHPRLQQPQLLRCLTEKGIAVQAWAPLMRGRADGIPELASIAAAHGKSASQVCVRWVLQQGFSAIPKSIHSERILENADVFDFELSAEEMARIGTLDADERLGGHHPDDVWRGVSSL